MLCTASGVDWKCDRVATVRSNCPAHYQQSLKGKPYTIIAAKKRRKLPNTVERYCVDCAKAPSTQLEIGPGYCSACDRNRQIFSRYGIIQKDVDAMLEAQGGVCDICGVDSPDRQGWHIDHDHNAPKGFGVRAILCGSCNKGLGNFRENLESLQKAIDYLKFHNARRGAV